MRYRKVQLRSKRKQKEESDEEFVLEDEKKAKRSNVKRPIDQGVGSASKRRGRVYIVCLGVKKWNGVRRSGQSSQNRHSHCSLLFLGNCIGRSL